MGIKAQDAPNGQRLDIFQCIWLSQAWFMAFESPRRANMKCWSQDERGLGDISPSGSTHQGELLLKESRSRTLPCKAPLCHRICLNFAKRRQKQRQQGNHGPTISHCLVSDWSITLPSLLFQSSIGALFLQQHMDGTQPPRAKQKYRPGLTASRPAHCRFYVTFYFRQRHPTRIVRCRFDN